MGGEGKGCQKESVNEWNMEKGRAERGDEKRGWRGLGEEA